jgi:hypothetical protein
MKRNEVLEKLYLLPNGLISYCRTSDEDVEYIRTDAFEVKEVDLEKEYKDFVEEDPVYNKLVNGIVGKAIAKHFFELGFKAQKGE